MNNTKSSPPLKGIIVLDLTRVLAGPYSTMVLRDLGARVIKVEPPDGDDSRKFGPFINNISSYFTSLNREKESIVLNLKNKSDKNIFLKLLKKSDVLVENYRPGTMEKLGLGPKKLTKIYPKLIYASCSGFGRTGPWAKKPAYDLIVQALGGIMSLTGINGTEPVRVGSSIGDIIAGLFTTIGIQSALIRRNVENIGSIVDISMLDCQVAILENAISRYFSEKKVPGKLGSRHPSICPFECYKCKNDFIVIAAGNNNLFFKLCEALDATELSKKKIFENNEKRLKNADKLKVEIEKILINKTSNFWIKRIDSFGVPVSKVNSIKETVDLEQVKKRNMIIAIKAEKKTEFKISGNPIKINGVKEKRYKKKAPLLNQDKIKILNEFNISVEK